MSDAAFSVDGMFFLAVLGMTAITYSLRAGGYWVMGRLPITPRVRRGLEALPGAIIVSTVLPIVLQGGLAVGLCLIVAAAAQIKLRKEYIAVFCAAAAAAALRAGGL
ncbi:MAG: AzlD domain-containing protein [Roseibium sp.]|uniref:AzlD family protein n=1 Tax=Roseibium sp. TaxID=1936156 RepID=UPI001B0CB354|nr:AzlD domain-containing protein [Roseibium sp.]MBO6512199.1 AzlD domain-containing protein [Roseibium sp.]MBO6890513.1 AzlD domain-containing protein [Roseibium sp.]MBO6929558.1 AzlD domain-containing protein [Roseibium sp.]